MSVKIWMIMFYKGAEYIKWTSSGTWIYRDYYRENILKNKCFK